MDGFSFVYVFMKVHGDEVLTGFLQSVLNNVWLHTQIYFRIMDTNLGFNLMCFVLGLRPFVVV